MTIGEIFSLVHSTPDFPREFSIYRLGKPVISELTFEDLTAEDWVIRTEAGVFEGPEEALRELGLNFSHVDTLSMQEHVKMLKACFVEEYPEDINSHGISVVGKSLLEAIPVLSSLVYSNDFNFEKE